MSSVEELLALAGRGDDPAPYLVLGDLLQQQGDPLGTLIVLMMGDDEGTRHRARMELAHRGELVARRLNGSVVRITPRSFRVKLAHVKQPWRTPFLTLAWRWGFVHELEINDYDHPLRVLDAVIDERWMAVVRSIRLRGARELDDSVLLLTELAPTSLRKLMLQGPTRNEAIGPLQELWNTLPQLEAVVLRGRFELGIARLPALRSLRLGGATAETWHQLVRCELPALQELYVAGPECDWELAERILVRFPTLQRVDIGHRERISEVRPDLG